MLVTPKTGFLTTRPIWLSCYKLLIITRKGIGDAHAKSFDLSVIRLGGWGLLEMKLILVKKIYSKTCLKLPLEKKTKIVFQD